MNAEVADARNDVADRFVVFDCEGDRCIGVISQPLAPAASRVGVVILVGGPQYRVGSHRQFALLARELARGGVPVLRFDFRGMGDSDGQPAGFEAVDQDIDAAIGTLQRESGVERVVLWGLCDGATAAFIHAPADRRVAGIVGVNPWARYAKVEASVRLRHYYLARALSRRFWSDALARRFDMRSAARGLCSAFRTALAGSGRKEASYLDRMQDGWARFAGPVLVVLSGRDFTAREFEAWIAADRSRGAMFEGPRCEVARFDDADHTFARRAWRDAVALATCEWIERAVPVGSDDQGSSAKRA